MDEYFLAPVLATFRASIDAQFPHRDHSSDGWIGDASHAARTSEHNPCWACPGYLHGIVRAIDVDIDDNDPGRDLRREIISSAVGHRAVWYVISNGIIWSRTFDWKPRVYTGPNQHLKHVHISCWTSIAAAKDQTLLLKRLVPTPPAKDTDVLNLEDKKYIDGRMQAYSLWLDMRSRRAELLAAKAAGAPETVQSQAQKLYDEATEAWEKDQA